MSNHDDHTVSFDMCRHALVLAVPVLGIRPDGNAEFGQPVVAMNGGRDDQIPQMLRAIAADMEEAGLENIGSLK